MSNPSDKEEQSTQGDVSKNPKPANAGNASSATVTMAEEALQKLNVKALFGQLDNDNRAKDMAIHKFWQTQPVPHFDETVPSEDGPIEPEDLSKVPKEPLPLLPGFEWDTMDMTDNSEIDDVYQLLTSNYVEDGEAMFRFKYSASFLDWSLKPPGWRKEWHIGIRASESRKLLAFISGVPIKLRVKSKTFPCLEVNFLCVHKKLRTKRLAPILIREVTRRANLLGIWQGIYTAGVLLPTPVSTCRYFHRSLDWPKLNEVGFSPLPPGSTKSRQVLRNKLPEKTSVTGLRVMQKKDMTAVSTLLKRYLDRMEMAQDFTVDELEHWLLDDHMPPEDKVVHAYVVERNQDITDFFSFYCLESTVIGNIKHNTIRAAYLYYYATDVALKDNGKDKTVLKTRLNQLMNDALILAKKNKFDVFNALTLLDNPLFLQDQKFGPGDGRLHYYLYNYRTAPIAGGIDDRSSVDTNRMGGIGVVML